ncbi:MAG TPA: hypothetical protein ENK46_08120 [Flavobacteriia bacterium]|nr:hypothetical protein [Flavobacteriia bacterium]
MKHKYNLFLLSCLFGLAGYSQSMLEKPTAYISISAFVGKHTIAFKDYAHSKGWSFGFSLSLGLYLVNSNDYHGGLQYTLLEGASYEKNRRQVSEDFILPNTKYDKHILFKFTQFRSSTVGWFNEFDTGDFSFFHRIGFGIFGTTEKDQLFDFSMHNALGILSNNPSNTRLLISVIHDAQIGIGNPNYTMSNTAFTIGGFRSFN